MSKRARSLVLSVAALAACVGPEPQADAGALATSLAREDGPIELVLPDSVQAWRAALQADARALDALLDELLSRWPVVAPDHGRSLRLVLAPSPQHAAQLAEQWGLHGDAHVPRTHLGARLAIVPMPRLDSLLSSRSAPPRTLRETIRHEMVHLLALDRPELSAAPRWFQEGLAEACVGLQWEAGITPQTHALGNSWRAALARCLEEGASEPQPLLQRLNDVPAELRYLAWAELAQRCMQLDVGPEPWTRVDEVVEAFETPLARAASFSHDLPRVLGRDMDFVAGGRSVLLVARAGEAVALEARTWDGEQPWQLRARVGRATVGHAEIVLGAAGDPDCARIRLNGNGGIAAGWEARAEPPKRAFRDRFPAGALQLWREVELQIVPCEPGRHARADAAHPYLLLVRSGEFETRLELPAGCEPRPSAPWELAFSVSDGSFEVIADRALVAALR